MKFKRLTLMERLNNTLEYVLETVDILMKLNHKANLDDVQAVETEAKRLFQLVKDCYDY